MLRDKRRSCVGNIEGYASLSLGLDGFRLTCQNDTIYRVQGVLLSHLFKQLVTKSQRVESEKRAGHCALSIYSKTYYFEVHELIV